MFNQHPFILLPVSHSLACRIHPTKHLQERMSETQRGFSPEEVENAVFRGSKIRLENGKYIGTYGICEVKVAERPCKLYVTTVHLRNR